MKQTARRPGLVILATLCFALLDTGSQYAGRLAVPVLMAIWLRFAIQTLMTTALLWPQYRGRLFQTQAPRAQLLRGQLMIGSFGFSFLSLMFIPVGEFTAIMMLIPLAVTLLASLILRERVGPLGWQWLSGSRQWAAIALMGLFGSIGHYLLIKAFQQTPASRIAPYLYAQIGFATLAGWAAFGHASDKLALLGIAVIALCGLASARLRRS